MSNEDHSTLEANVGDPIDDIAALLMGGDDSGGEGEADPTNEQTPATPDTEDDDGAEELPDESTDGDDDVDESDEETDEADEAADGVDDESLAKMLGIDESQLSVLDDGGFKINLKIDGENSQMSLADVIKINQTEGSLTNKSKAFADDRKAFDDAVVAKATEIKETLQRNQQLTQMLEQELMAEFEHVEWDDLRQFDPAEWSAKRQEFGTKYQRVQRMKQVLESQSTEADEVAQKEFKAKEQVYLKGQWDSMLNNNPTWSNKAAYAKDMTAIRDFASEAYGFGDEDFKHVTDSRTIEMAKDAMAFRKGQKAGKKKLVKVPRVQKRGGVRKVAKLSKLDKLTRAAKTASGAAKRDLQTDAVAELLMGG